MPPNPTPILRFTHVDNIPTLVRRRGFHAPNQELNDGLLYRTVFGLSEQNARASIVVPCGPGGTLHDYVPFYFGPLSPMMLRLKTGRVEGYDEGQEPLIYCVSSVQTIAAAGLPFVFSDGHGLARFTQWFDSLERLDAVDWAMVNERYWTDTAQDMDRQRRKQAEFLVHRTCLWSVIERMVVMSESMKQRVENTLAEFPEGERRLVEVRRDWYY